MKSRADLLVLYDNVEEGYFFNKWLEDLGYHTIHVCTFPEAYTFADYYGSQLKVIIINQHSMAVKPQFYEARALQKKVPQAVFIFLNNYHRESIFYNLAEKMIDSYHIINKPLNHTVQEKLRAILKSYIEKETPASSSPQRSPDVITELDYDSTGKLTINGILKLIGAAVSAGFFGKIGADLYDELVRYIGESKRTEESTLSLSYHLDDVEIKLSVKSITLRNEGTLPIDFKSIKRVYNEIVGNSKIQQVSFIFEEESQSWIIVSFLDSQGNLITL